MRELEDFNAGVNSGDLACTNNKSHAPENVKKREKI